MANAGLVDDALVAVLKNDAALMALCPDGVWWGIAPQGKTKSVVLSLLDHSDRPSQDATTEYTLYERAIYLVKAVLLMTDGGIPQGAAARIHDLLHGAELNLTAAGYTPMLCRRIERVRYPEIEPVNKARWQHEGGQYEVWSYPT